MHTYIQVHIYNSTTVYDWYILSSFEMMLNDAVTAHELKLILGRKSRTYRLYAQQKWRLRNQQRDNYNNTCNVLHDRSYLCPAASAQRSCTCTFSLRRISISHKYTYIILTPQCNCTIIMLSISSMQTSVFFFKCGLFIYSFSWCFGL